MIDFRGERVIGLVENPQFCSAPPCASIIGQTLTVVNSATYFSVHIVTFKAGRPTRCGRFLL